MTEQKMLKIFLCHAPEDKSAVRELYRQLSAEGWLDVWLGSEKILPGQDWDIETQEAVEQSNIVIACISNQSVNKEGYIQKELRKILSIAEEKPEGTIFVIPLKLEDCEVPRQMQNWQWVDYYPIPIRNQAYSRLMKSLEQRAKDLDIPIKATSNNIPETAANLSVIIEQIIEQRSLRPEVRPHAFVLMPFGKKKGADGSLYDFNEIYTVLIKPALEEAGFEPFRADEETTSGNFLTDMFQELLLADFVLADMSIDNANTYYQLGVRHALRKRGVVHIQAGRSYMPFKTFNVRTLPYHITPEGVPDQAFLYEDISEIARLARDTWASSRETIHSPIYNLLNALKEPDLKSLRTPLATGFWREYVDWKDRVTIAQKQKRTGDILLLTEELKNPLIMEEAIAQAGQALTNMGHYELALAQYRKGLEINFLNMDFRRQEAFQLNRLGRKDEAIYKLESILAEAPRDSEAKVYLARIYKETWMDAWKEVTDPEKRLHSAFDASHWLVKAYQTYLDAFLENLSNYYPGTNAMMLGSVLSYLAERYDDPDEPDPEIREVREKLPDLQGALELVLEARGDESQVDFWSLISLAELRLLTAKTPSQVSRAYRKAIAVSRENIFFIQASIKQLDMLNSLQLRAEFIQAGMDVLTEEYTRITKEEYGSPSEEKTSTAKKPVRQVFLFTGYMEDEPRQVPSRFSPDREHQLVEAFQALLEKYNAGREDLVVMTGLSAGSEILFAECCVGLRIPVQVYMPLAEEAYIKKFISTRREEWAERFKKLHSHPLVSESIQTENLGEPNFDDNLYERNNRWALYSSIVYGLDKVHLISFWDGTDKGNQQDGLLVNHMVKLMRDVGGHIEQVNPTKIFRY